MTSSIEDLDIQQPAILEQSWGDMDDDDDSPPMVKPSPPKPLYNSERRERDPSIKSSEILNHSLRDPSLRSSEKVLPQSSYGRNGERDSDIHSYRNEKDSSLPYRSSIKKTVLPPPGTEIDATKPEPSSQDDRKPLKLKKRSVNERPLALASYNNSPFGKAVPREEILAHRSFDKDTPVNEESNKGDGAKMKKEPLKQPKENDFVKNKDRRGKDRRNRGGRDGRGRNSDRYGRSYDNKLNESMEKKMPAVEVKTTPVEHMNMFAALGLDDPESRNE